MLTCIYVVEKIDGDYAELRRVDALAQDQEENKVMARASGWYYGRKQNSIWEFTVPSDHRVRSGRIYQFWMSVHIKLRYTTK